MISTIILTKNEEADLPICLASLQWCDDIHVLDSGSTDKTIDIANEYGAKVWHKTFKSFGQQRNFALDNLIIKYDWILFLDADEVITEEFKASIITSIKSANNEVAGFYCCWKMILEGKWLKRCDNFPKWQFRVLKKNKARFTDFGHGQKEADIIGYIDYIKEPYLHYGFSKGWSQWVDRHNKYSSQEAVERYHNRPPFKNIFARHGSIRNPALKSWLVMLPGWPLMRFFQAYFWNLGFLEGAQGFIFCANIAYYEFLIQIKIRSIKIKYSK
jgi:glycosyltransferase involved in cell wall biosynthesis